MTKRLSTTEFIERSTIIHNNKYNYSLTTYIGRKYKVLIICPIHGEFYSNASDHLTGCGCPKCTPEKRKQTNLTRFGYDNPFKSPEILLKCKETLIQNHGVDHNWKSHIVQENRRQTWISKYGVDHPGKSEIVKTARKLTCSSKYGVEHALQSAIVRDKREVTLLKVYGVAHNMQSLQCIQKRKQTWKLKYNVSHSKQKHMIDILPNLQNFDWLYNQYITLGKTSLQIATELGVVSESTILKYLHSHEIEIRTLSGFSQVAIQWLESIMEQEQIFIQHAGNIGEYKIPGTRYSVDGYCQETNTCYEFHGDCWHGNPLTNKPDDLCNPYSTLTAKDLYQKTLAREQCILTKGYNLIVLWEFDYYNNP